MLISPRQDNVIVNLFPIKLNSYILSALYSILINIPIAGIMNTNDSVIDILLRFFNNALNAK